MALVDGSQPGLLHGLLPAVEAEVGQALAGEGRSSPAAPVVTLGVPDGAKAATIAALRQRTAGPLLAIRPRPNDAQALLEELQAWLPAAAAGSLLLFPPRESLPYEQRPQSDEAAHARLTVLAALAAGDAPLIVTDGQALSQRTRPRGPALPRLRTGAQLAIEPFLATLGGAGYRAAAVADEAGTFARRGGIIDVFPPAMERPVRIELLGDTIDSLRSYDPLTQRSVQPLAEAVLQPASEATVDKAAQAWAASLRKALRRGASVDSPAGQSWARDLEQIEGGALPGEAAFWTPFLAGGTLWDHLPPETLIIREEAEEIRHHLDELDELAERTRETLEGRGDIPAGLPHPHLRRAELSEALESRRPRIDLQRFGQEEPKQARRSLGFTPVAAYGGRLRMLIDDLRRVIDRGERVTLVSLQAPRLAELLQEHGLPVAAQAALVDPPPAGAVTLVRGSAPAGWGLPASDGGGQVLLTDREVFSFAKQRRPRPARPRKHTTFLDDLQPGHYVVHVEHGIGRFVGVTREQVGGREYEYLELEYAGSDRLLVPTDQLRRLQRYIGPSGSRPSLTRLGTQQWQRAKQRVRAAVRQLAEELLQLYATRQVVPRPCPGGRFALADGAGGRLPLPGDGGPGGGGGSRESGPGAVPPDGPDRGGGRGLRQDGGGGAGGLQGRDEWAAGGHAGAHHGVGAAALGHLPRTHGSLSRADRDALAVPLGGAAADHPGRSRGWAGRYRDRHAPAAAKGRAAQDAGAVDHRRRAALRRRE